MTPIIRLPVRATTAFCVAAFVVPMLSLSAQGSSRTLLKPEAEHSEPFSLITAVRELRDGRVLVTDAKDKVVQLVDLKSNHGTKVGREGSGPGEYGLPMGMMPMPGDTSIVFDPLNGRYLTILPDGKPGKTFRLEDGAPPPPAEPAGAPRRGGGQIIQSPRAVDGQGRLYFESSPIVFGPNGPIASDSAAVMRFDRKTYRYDTLAFVQLQKGAASVTTTGSAGNQNVSVRMGNNQPFPARDSWTVLANGTLVIARVKDYHLEIVSPTRQVTKTAPVPFTPIKVGEAEKKEYRDAQKAPAGVGITRSVDNGKVTTGTAPIAPAEEPKEWPSVKPPFTMNGIYAAPNGDVWVSRSRAAKDETPKYDVFSATGRLTGTVAFPKRTRIVGFGAAGAIYTIRTDEDDLQYLQRFRG